MESLFENQYELNSLIRACIKNDSTSQRKLYDQYAPKMFGICLRYGVDYAEAEDMLQEGFVKIFRNIDKYNFTGSFQAWVSRIVANNCIDILRKKPNLYTIFGDDDAPYLEADNVDALDSLYEQELIELIQDLPNGYRSVFNMYVMDGYTHKEIAEKLNITEGTSKSQLNRARKLLQKKITELDKLSDLNSKQVK